MKRILIVESDEELGEKLSGAIRSIGDFAISQAITVREACLLIAQKPHHLGLLPASDWPAGGRALHSLQPDLPLAVVTSEEVPVMPERDSDAVPGVISVEHLEEDLRRLLTTDEPEPGEPPTETLVDAYPVREPDETIISPPPEPEQAETVISTPPPAEAAKATPSTTVAPQEEETLISAAPDQESPDQAPAPEEEQRVRLALESVAEHDKIVGSVLTTEDGVIAFGGVLSAEQVRAIARRVLDTWHEGNSALLQFIRPPERPADLLLFTRPARHAQLLTLAAAPDFNVGRVRRAADALASELATLASSGLTEEEVQTSEQSAVVDTGVFHSAPAAHDSFALIFQPRRPLPAALQPAISKALQDVASSAGLTLHYQQVVPDLVHIVTSCPPGQGSGWLAHLYKRGVEERIQAQFGVQANLWRRGFYATESERPLSDIELKLFAEQ